MDSVQGGTEISGWTSQYSRVKRDSLSCTLVLFPAQVNVHTWFILLNAIYESLDIFTEVRMSSN